MVTFRIRVQGRDELRVGVGEVLKLEVCVGVDVGIGVRVV